MEKLTNQQRAERAELAQKFSQAQNELFDRQKKKFSEDVNLFLNSSYRSNEGMNSPLGQKLLRGLEDGTYKKPSEFVTKELSCLFGTRVPKEMKESLLYAVDECRSSAFSYGYTRRPFRSQSYALYGNKIHTIIYDYAVSRGVRLPFEQIVSGKLSAMERANIEEYPNQRNEYDIAYCIDKGMPTTIQYIRELLEGGSADGLTYDIFRAVFMSHNAELHELAGKLLLAAKLQEGLRQAICETCDCGSLEAFKYMLGVITENDLIRYSSVKRAVGTWTGLIAYDSGDLERISSKTLALINGCLSDDAFRIECLASDDAMKVHIGLWSIAVHDAKDCKAQMDIFCKDGTHPQLMAAAYFMRELWSGSLRAELAKSLLLTRSEELDVMALIVDHLFAGSRISNADSLDPKNRLLRCFADRAEGEEVYAKLKGIYQKIPKKELVFSPCVFPWNTEKLTKSDIVQHMIFVAAILEDNDKIDEMCPKIPEIDVSGYGSRSGEIKLLLSDPKTDIQLDTLVTELADREEYSRKTAFELVKNVTLAPRHYRMLEDMLRYKAADIRMGIIELLMGLPDDDLFECVSRLVSDKKEEKRTAGLDIIMQLAKADRTELYGRCLTLIPLIAKPSTKEQILIDQLRPAEDKQETVYGYGLFTKADTYKPKLDEKYAAECDAVFAKYFPNSKLIKGNGKKPADDFTAVLKALDKLIEAHKNDEYTDAWGEKRLLGSRTYFREKAPDGTQRIPFMELWDKFYEEHIADPVLLFRSIMGQPAVTYKGLSYKLFGKEFDTDLTLAHGGRVSDVLDYYRKHLDPDELTKAAYSMINCIYRLSLEGTEMFYETDNEGSSYYRSTYRYVKNGKVVETQKVVTGIFDDGYVKRLYNSFRIIPGESFGTRFALSHALARQLGAFILNDFVRKNNKDRSYLKCYFGADYTCYIRAAFEGIISEGYMYRYFFEEAESLGDVLELVSGITQSYRDSERKKMTRQRWGGWRSARALSYLLNEDKPEITDENRPLVEFAVGIYEKLVNLVLGSELKRGDSPAEFTSAARSISRIYGADRFVQILAALGKDTLERSAGYYSSGDSKRHSLSRLLGVCVPRETDTTETLGKLIKETDITEKRLVEAALYTPEWISTVGEYLGWEGFDSACFYFIAHMNEHFSDVQKAQFARYTPIPTEELAIGAFDIGWFKEASETLGEKRFDMIYDAAKYISDGAKHSRARKYADAVRGRLSLQDAEKQINDKRNKDTLMASALIPITDDDDILYRYRMFARFRKESSSFGAQRKASESAAADMAMRNLAENAGFSDVTRLTMRMETKMFDDIRPLTEPQQLDDLTLRLAIDETGKCEIECIKGGKALKSIPAKYKKNELVVRLNDTKKQLTEQYRRTRLMFEQAMEDCTLFTAAELTALTENPVVSPIVLSLVYVSGKSIGMLEGMSLVSTDGKKHKLKADSELKAAHPLDLYNEGTWHDYQKLLFDRRLVQPFKQVFRELYVKTEDEREAFTSLRYSGNQIQPKKTVACLKSRRWVADIEDGLQKIYYKENIIARIYALADWFSPADIEAPTLEWVEFFDRKNGKQLCIKDIPDVIFSEVMRDVDLAVSVAHAGGVDPETSHSTIELRRAVCEFTAELFKLTNVRFEKSHAFITGERADYSVHLGSGVVHIQGGAMINLLPVHSQHKGRLFLPFVDDDPKTAQIISEILLFADDKSIKDPFILGQIR